MLLAMVTLVMLAVALIKADDRRFLLAFLAAVLGLLYIFEYALVALADAYRYHPMALPGDAFQDTVVGNIYSQTSITSALGLIIALRLKFLWRVALAAGYYLVELLFLRLGVYEVHWYPSILTPMIFVLLSWAVPLWHERTFASRSRAATGALVFLGALAVTGNTVYLPFKIAKVHVFTGGFFGEASRDHVTTILPYSVVFIGALMCIHRAELRRYWKALLAAALYMMQYAAFKAGLMTFRPGCFIPATVLEICVFYFWISLLDRLVRRHRPPAIRA